MMSPSDREKALAEIARIDPEIVPFLERRDGTALLLSELPKRVPPRPGLDEAACRVWELVGLLFLNSGRVYESLELFWGLYENMLKAQATASRIHKGMPLVWLSDCFTRLGYSLLAKRYMMLTLCEDALRDRGCILPETTGTYFRMVWSYGMSHAELQRYAKEAHAFSQEHADLATFPEAILQHMDDVWLSEVPSPREMPIYRINRLYGTDLLNQLGDSKGEALERLAHYLMSCIPGCRAKLRSRSVSTDYDLVCAVEGQALDFRDEFGRYFVCECKD
jgi:hypothetical protein